MHRLVVASLIAGLLAGCSDPVAEAEARRDIVKRRGSPDDICEAERMLAQAYLEARREQDYALQDITADLACNRVAIDELGR